MMHQMEQEFLRAIESNNNRLVFLCLEKGLTANTCDDNGNTALEYALRFRNDEVLARLAIHPKTTQKTLGRTLDLLEILRLSDKELWAAKEYEKKSIFFEQTPRRSFFKQRSPNLFKSSKSSLQIHIYTNTSI